VANLLVLNSFKGIRLIDNWIRFSQQLCVEQRHGIILGQTSALMNCYDRQKKKLVQQAERLF
jgi:hypothetical protein